MFFSKLLPIILLSGYSKAETVVGLYIFSRHGDRTAKSTPPTGLTDLGYLEIFNTASWYRSQYIADGAPKQIAGISPDLVKFSQLSVSASYDDVIGASAIGFTQGLYPPVNSAQGTELLRNTSTVSAPLSGYQLVPIQQTTSGTGSENSAWIQGASNCANAIISSNNYFSSAEYDALLNSTHDFYVSLMPMINSTFTAETDTFKNAYTIFDYLNVASIHNTTFPSSDLLTNETLFQLRTLADNHEFNLAFNATDPIRAVAGATLAAQVVQGLNTTITSAGATKISLQVGAYNSFQSYFGLTNLTNLSPNWTAVPDYASTMAWELFTNGSADPFPSADELNVRFYFSNGSVSSNATVPFAAPLFGSGSTVISWNDFVNASKAFAIGDQASWCTACGNTTGVCAAAGSTDGGSSSSSAQAAPNSGSVSPAVGGVIGAMVTLAVILGLEALILLAGGLRVVSKKRVGAAPAAATPAKA